MNLQEIISLLQIEQGMPIVSVRFLDDKRPLDAENSSYTYKCAAVPNPQVGETVAVETYKGPKLASIVAVLSAAEVPPHMIEKLQHVMGRLDLTDFHKVQENEATVRRKLAMAEINERLASVRRFVPSEVNLIAHKEEPLHEPN